jgi:CubicO group peptidase (beta-lactamase class C family)
MRSIVRWQILTVLALTVALLARPAHAADPLSGLDDYVTKSLAAWQVPGVAIAIVKDDKVVYAKGFGVRKIGEKANVDAKTLFAIGSCSKAFTAALVGMLVDDGKLAWDDPVTKHMPSFELFDADATRNLAIRDLLTHRMGLDRGDLLWYGSQYSRAEVLRRMRFLKPKWSVRSHFGYQNIMFLAAGELAATVSGKSWDALVKERIFTPLGMTGANTSVSKLAAEKDVASPHALVDGKVQPVPWRNVDNTAPAGAINASVTDMAQWLRFQLGDGTFGGKRLLASGTLDEMHNAQITVPLDPAMAKLSPSTHFMAYGLGWFLNDYQGRKIIEHGGNIDGMSAGVALVPEEHLGIVILSNMNGTMLPNALVNHILDAYFGDSKVDWSVEMLKLQDAGRSQAEQQEKTAEESRIANKPPSLALDAYAGTYTDELYGDLTIALEQGGLVLKRGQLTAKLEAWHFDTFRANFGEPVGKTFVTFALDEKGKVGQATMKFGDDTVVWKRQDAIASAAEVKLTDAQLARLTGTYHLEQPSLDVEVQVVSGKLKVSVPGQPSLALVPISPTKFRADGIDGISFEFTLDAKGKPTALVVDQRGTKLTLKIINSKK